MNDSDNIGAHAEYDFSAAERGKHAEIVPIDATMVVLDPDVATEFPTSESVNIALRALVALRRNLQGVA